MLRRIPDGLPDSLPRDRTCVMGILNVTPDSFSDGGRFQTSEQAVSAARAMMRYADIIDVGGESTRPGAQRVNEHAERQRVIPVVRALAAEGIPVSIDTTRATIAAEALEAGACLVNDVSGGRADPGMLPLLGEVQVPVVIMHWRAHSERMEEFSHYDDVVDEVVAEIAEQLDACDRHGIDRGKVVVDPGLGFAKTTDDNWALLHHLDRLANLGAAVLIGASRKRFLGHLLADETDMRPVNNREAATTAITALAAAAGVWAVRVHDVRDSADAVRVVRAWERG